MALNEENQWAKQLRDEYPFFATNCLKVRDKSGNIIPYDFNYAQQQVHAAIEKQKAQMGWVRALILKGRQQGISTYVGGRFYHQSSTRKGVNVYILSHEQSSSDTLFGIVDRYQRNNPVAPHVGVSNAKELVFDRLDSSYAVATAGTKAGGRSKAILLFHGSEVAYWTNAGDHFAASVQGVPLVSGSEVILESTSAGAGGEFYERCLDAEAGRGDYILIFVPWWWSAEYARDPELGFTLSSEAEEGEMSEQEYADTYEVGLPQMAWRRSKIIELRSEIAFRREYPATSAEAWTPPVGFDPMIAPLIVVRARHRKAEAAGPLILGVDPASNGGDRFAVAARRGNRILWVQYRNKIDTLEGTAWIRSLIDELNPARVNIDAGNIGAAIVTNLKSIGPRYVNIVRGVNFGGTSEAKMAKPKVPGPANRRAEMWARMRDWLMSVEGVQIPDDPALQTDLTSPRLKAKLNNDFLLESKSDLKKRGVKSPDLADSCALTFAFNEWIEHYNEDKKQVQFGNPDSAPAASPYSDITVLGAGTGWMA